MVTKQEVADYINAYYKATWSAEEEAKIEREKRKERREKEYLAQEIQNLKNQ